MSSSTAAGLVKGLGLLDATTLVMGSMIGSGIFIVSADIARQTQSPGLLIVTWIIAAALTLTAALCYGELAAAMPRAGGQYVYLREAFGPLSGFLFGWTTFLVIQTGTIAAVAVAFAKFTGVFLPSISASRYLLGSGKLGLGVGIVSILYIASNFVYLNVLPLDAIQRAPEDRVATAAASVIFGPVAVQLMAAAIMISTFGCANGLILSGARVYYAMALDG